METDTEGDAWHRANPAQGHVDLGCTERCRWTVVHRATLSVRRDEGMVGCGDILRLALINKLLMQMHNR